MQFDTQRLLTAFESELGKLNRSQKSGLSFLIKKINDDTFDMLEHVAYFLASIYWESARTFQPISEIRAGRNQTKLREIQDKYWDTGYFGRGYIQITWEANYKKFGIEKTPEKALQPETAYIIASRGMREGLFSRDENKKPYTLSRFIRPGKIDYRGARHIVNGTDKAVAIQGIAIGIERALNDSLIVDTSPAPEPTDTSILDSTNLSTDTLKKGAPIAAKVARSFIGRVAISWALGEYLKLSIYALLILAVGVAVFHYRKQIWAIVKKLASKIT
jgi:hypothetical protein